MDISVIIPVYNVEQYLKRCVDSVLCQKRISLEIILVDSSKRVSIRNRNNSYSKPLC